MNSELSDSENYTSSEYDSDTSSFETNTPGQDNWTRKLIRTGVYNYIIYKTRIEYRYCTSD